MSRFAQEKDPEILHKAIDLLRNHNRALATKIAELLKELAEAKGDSGFQQLRIAALEKSLAKLTKEIFGPSTEQRPVGATGDGDGGDDDKNKDDGEKKKKKRRGHGPTEQPKLPIIDVVHKLDDADKTCPKCGGGLHEMKDQFEEAGEIDVIPMRFVYKNHKRQKYVCGCGGCVDTAIGPDKLVPGGRYSVDFAIYVAIAKYTDHLPLERQVRMMARDGLVVTSATLWDQIERLVRLVESAMPRLLAHVLSHGVVGADETTWEMFDTKPGQGKSWYVWIFRVDSGVYYTMRDGRSHTKVETLVASFAGVLMCDGYSGYVSLSTKYPRETIPLPHEVKALLAEGKLDPSDFDDHTEGILGAALAAAEAAARAGPSNEPVKRESGEPSSAR